MDVAVKRHCTDHSFDYFMRLRIHLGLQLIHVLFSDKAINCLISEISHTVQNQRHFEIACFKIMI